jgi:hypothetical protein
MKVLVFRFVLVPLFSAVPNLNYNNVFIASTILLICFSHLWLCMCNACASVIKFLDLIVIFIFIPPFLYWLIFFLLSYLWFMFKCNQISRLLYLFLFHFFFRYIFILLIFYRNIKYISIQWRCSLDKIKFECFHFTYYISQINVLCLCWSP